jgi:hypothetical protein
VELIQKAKDPIQRICAYHTRLRGTDTVLVQTNNKEKVCVTHPDQACPYLLTTRTKTQKISRTGAAA